MRHGLLLLLAFAWIAQGAVYYVSPSTGSDGNNGTSAETAWGTVSNAYRMQPGDSLLLKAGDRIDGPLYPGGTHPGTAEARITVDRYGAGANPILNGNHPSATWSAVGGFTGIYVTPVLAQSWAINMNKVYDVFGFKFTNIPRGADTLNNWLGTFTNSAWGQDGAQIYIRNTNDAAPPQMWLMEYQAVSLPAYWTIQNLEIIGGGHGVTCAGIGNIVRSNYIHDTASTAIGLYDAHNCEVAYNDVRTNGYTQIYIYRGGNHWVHHNTTCWTGLDAGATGTLVSTNCLIPLGENCSSGIQQSTNNLVEHNSFLYSRGDFVDWWLGADSEVRFNYGFHSGAGSVPDGTGIKLHHNIFDMDDAGGGIGGYHDYDPVNSVVADSGPVEIYNNTIYNYRGNGLYTSGAMATNVIFRNNICMTASAYALVRGCSVTNGTDCDFNLYYGTGTPMKFYANTTTYNSLAEYVAAFGQDSHSVYGDPQFVTAIPVSALDFRIQSSSPAKYSGVVISGSLTDYLGKGLHSPPSIGAFEYGGIASPFGLKILEFQ